LVKKKMRKFEKRYMHNEEDEKTDIAYDKVEFVLLIPN
jgi:hypothetical protein